MLRAEYDKELLHRVYLEVSPSALSRHLLFFPSLPSTQRLENITSRLTSVCLFNFLQEYLRRFADLILTASGLGLPLEHDNATCTASSLFYLEDAVKDASVTVIGRA
jgi:hypothetical protein